MHAKSGTQILERLDLDDSLIGHQHMAANPDAPDMAHHSALAASPERIVLLTTQGTSALNKGLGLGLGLAETLHPKP